MASIVRAQCAAPKSGRSSRSTEVTTAWRSPIRATLSATFSGSFGSSGRGFPVRVLQKRQERVQISPPIMKVAVPRLQHSPMLGHFPLVQIVWRQCDSTIRFVCVNRSLPPSLILSHSGFFTCSTIALTSYRTGNWTFSYRDGSWCCHPICRGCDPYRHACQTVCRLVPTPRHTRATA